MDGQFGYRRREDQGAECEVGNGDLAAQKSGQSLFQFRPEQRGNDPKTDHHVEQEKSRDDQADLSGQSYALVFLVR